MWVVEFLDHLGLLHPVVVRPDGLLIAGERRIAACRKLGWKDIPVTEVDLEQVARGERAENLDRKPFTLSEVVAIGKTVEEYERGAAKARIVEGARAGGKASGKLPEASTGDTRDKVAAYAGTTGRSSRAGSAIGALSHDRYRSAVGR